MLTVVDRNALSWCLNCSSNPGWDFAIKLQRNVSSCLMLRPGRSAQLVGLGVRADAAYKV